MSVVRVLLQARRSADTGTDAAFAENGRVDESRRCLLFFLSFFFSSRRRHTRLQGDWSSDVCSSDLQHGKLSLRASDTSELVLSDVHVSADALLPKSGGLKSPLMCLTQARYGIAWGAMGAAMACFEEATSYSKTRVMFGKPIGGFQIQQARLADMLTELVKGQLLALHLGRMKDAGTLTPQQVSLAKRNNVSVATDIAREARRLLGANGILAEYASMRHMANLESVYTYEGTHDIH